MAFNASLLAILCAFFIAGASVRAEGEDKKESPLRASELSPLARAIDAILFGNGTREVAAYQLNLFATQVDPNSFKGAIGEVKKFRGEKYAALVKTGGEVNRKFLENVQNQALDIAKREDLFFNPPRRLARSWTALTGQNVDSEEPLPATEIGRRAQERTEAQVPFAFQGLQPLGMQDPDAKSAYQRNAHRIETFETQAKHGELSRAEFEDWREREVKALAHTMATNRIRILQSEARRDVKNFVWKDPANSDSRHWKTVTAEEIAEFFGPTDVEREIVGNQVKYSVPRSLTLNNPASRPLASSAWFKRDLLAQPEREANSGTLDEAAAAEQHLGELLYLSNVRTAEAIDKLNEFSYEQYRRDQGKRFFTALKTFNRETVEVMQKKHALPTFAASVPHLRNLTPGFELAMWGKFAEDGKFWSSGKQPKESLLDMLLSRFPGSWNRLSNEPPTPLSVHLENAKDFAWDTARKYGWIPAIALGAIALHEFTRNDAPPLADKPTVTAEAQAHAPRTGGAKDGRATTSPPPTKLATSAKEIENQITVVPVSPTTAKDALDQVGPGRYVDRAPPSNTMPPGLSKVGPAFNKPLGTEDSALFHIESSTPASELPRRFSLGDPAKATEAMSVPTDTTAKKFIVKSARLHRGPSEIPTGENSHLASLLVEGEDGEFWKPGTDYEVRATKTGEPVIFPKRSGRFSSRAGFAETPPDERAIQDESLRELDHGRLGKVAEELRQHGFTYLPEMIEATVTHSREKGIPISIFDLKDVLKESAYYSQVKEKRVPNLAILDEFQRASRFLNPEGVSCYECDGARELAVDLYRKSLPKKSGVEISPRSVIGRKADSLELTQNGLHADFAIHDHVHQQSFTLDTTPGRSDPRDPHPPSGEQVGFVEPPAEPPSERTKESPVGRGRENLAMPAPSSPKVAKEVAKEGSKEVTKTAQESPHDLGPNHILFSEVIVLLFKSWDRAELRRNPGRPATYANYAAAGPPEPPGKAIERMTTEPPTPTAAEHAEKKAVTFKMVPDEKLGALEDRISATAKSFAMMRMVPKKMGDGFAAIPTLNLVRAARLVESRVRGSVSEAEFEHAAGEFVGKDFVMPIGSLDRQIQAFIMAVEAEQMRLIHVYGEAWKRGNRDYPGLLGPSVPYEIRSLTKWVTERHWEAPRAVPDSATGSLCASLNRAAAE